jgi:hypothetical protein
MLDLLGDIGGGLLDVAKTAAPLVVSGAVMKHGGKATSWLPKDAIPFANGAIGVAIGTAVTGDTEQGAKLGVLAATSATGLHQALKIGSRALLERTLSPAKQQKIGPGDRPSI